MYLSCIQTHNWKEKLAVLMLPGFKGSLQRTKILTLKPDKRYMNFSEHFTKASMLVTHWSIFIIFRTLSDESFENLVDRQIFHFF